MPPLPTLSDLPSTLSSLQRRLHDLGTFQLPRLQTCKGPSDLLRELSEEMRSDLEGVRHSLEMCIELALVLPKVVERENVAQQCAVLQRSYLELKIAYRQALITAKKNMAVSHTSRRYEIDPIKGDSLDIGDVGTRGEKQRSTGRVEMGGDDALQSKTNEVTDALRRTTGIMQAELERSVLSVQMLEQSTQTLTLTQTLYSTYESLLSQSSHLVKTLERADKWDRMVLAAAFLLFLLVCGWVVKRRVLDKVVGGVGWWVGGSFRLLGMGVGLGRGSGSSRGKGLEGLGGVEMGRGKIGGGESEGNGKVKGKKGKGKGKASLLDQVIPETKEGSSAITSRTNVKTRGEEVVEEKQKQGADPRPSLDVSVPAAEEELGVPVMAIVAEGVAVPIPAVVEIPQPPRDEL